MNYKIKNMKFNKFICKINKKVIYSKLNCRLINFRMIF